MVRFKKEKKKTKPEVKLLIWFVTVRRDLRASGGAVLLGRIPSHDEGLD